MEIKDTTEVRTQVTFGEVEFILLKEILAYVSTHPTDFYADQIDFAGKFTDLAKT